MLETNKIYLGDCYDLIKQIPDKSIDLIYTDIPYEFASGGASKKEFGKRIKKSQEELQFKENKLKRLQKKQMNTEQLWMPILLVHQSTKKHMSDIVRYKTNYNI